MIRHLYIVTSLLPWSVNNIEMKSIVCLLIVFSATHCLAEPALFHAEYIAQYQGLPIKAKGVRELTRLGDNHYRLISSASSIFINIVESTEFDINGSHLQPAKYHYERKGMGKNKQVSSSFDWQENLVTHKGTTSALTAGTLDKLSYQYKLRLDVAQAIADSEQNPKLEYTIADEEKRKIYKFRIAGRETLDTPLGELRTIRIDRIRQDTDRQTSLWLALDHDLILVKLKQQEQKKGFELNLQSFSMED